MGPAYRGAMDPHPWRDLRDLAHVVVSWRADLPGYLRGATDGVDRIWLRSDLHQVERRCVLAHELEHLRARHHGCQPGDVEKRVRARTARHLLPDPRVIADALVWAAGDIAEAADVLWVTERVLRDRLDVRHLHPAERAIIVARISALEVGA